MYDAIGNPTTYRGKTATWTRGRKLTAYDGNTFSYDATGRRLSKNNIKFYYDSEGNLLKQSNGLEFFYGADGLVAIKYGGLPYLCRKDMLGNILALLDSSGNIVVQYKYDVVSSDINADMERINWNPFNNNAEAAAQASVFSFYKGVPVVIIDREDDRSGSFGIIFLDKDDRDADTIRHEYGHVPQLMMLGIARFAFCIGIPSSQQWGVGSSWEYYNAPWEASADFFGGVKSRQPSEETLERSMKYLLCSYFFGPFVHAFYKKIK